MGKNKRKRSHTKHVFVQKKYRDALFRRIFNEKPVLLELYNALNQTDYDDADELIFYTIDDVIYLGYKNDVSFIVRGTLNLYEHQSTLNPNMPIRGLIYFGKQYESYIKQNNLNIYGKKLLSLPFPQFVIFYNGVEPLEDNKDYIELHLSDAFICAESNHLTTNAAPRQPVVTTDMPVSDIDVPDSTAKNTPDSVSTRPCLECTARVYNINYGHNQELMARCRTLEEYSILIGRISSKVRNGIPLEPAADAAVQECIRDGILQDFLIKHRSEVVGMLLEEFDMDEYIKMERRDSYADGHEDGLAMGLAEGLAEGKRLEQLHIIHNMFQENIPAQSCAKLLNKDTAFIDKVYSLCQAHPDWSDEDLYNSLIEN